MRSTAPVAIRSAAPRCAGSRLAIAARCRPRSTSAGERSASTTLLDCVAEPVVLGLLHLVDDEEVELRSPQPPPGAAVSAEERDHRAVRERDLKPDSFRR
jgi:hypothetical protein